MLVPKVWWGDATEYPRCSGVTSAPARGGHGAPAERGVPFWAMNAWPHGFRTTPVFTNTQDAGKYLQSHGAAEGVLVWSQSISFFGLFSSDFAQRGTEREDGSIWEQFFLPGPGWYC